jgi:predicted methyltransferase
MFYQSLQQYIVNASEEYDILARVTQHPDRPRPVREIDQIFMLPGSQLNQAKLISAYTRHKEVVFVGDGDCMAASIGLLTKESVIDGPTHMTVLDFDQRVVDFALQAAHQFGFQDKLDAQQYNMLQPVPPDMRSRYDVFYTNPPYGSKNKGASGVGFLMRCMALCKPVGSMGDLPMLRSATVIFDRIEALPTPGLDDRLPKEITDYFYGSANRPIPKGIDVSGNIVTNESAS